MFEGRNSAASEPNIYNIITFVVWGTGLAGLILALWKEGLGGLISLLCFIILNILVAANPTPGSGYFPCIFTLHASLNIIYTLLVAKKEQET